MKGYDPNQAHALPESDAARRDLNLAVQNLRHEFETSQDYTSALSAATDVRLAYQKAMQDALYATARLTEYKTQQLEVAQAEEAVEDARQKSNDFTDVIAAANRASAARQAIGKMEADWLAADFAFTATKQTYLDAAAHAVAARAIQFEHRRHGRISRRERETRRGDECEVSSMFLIRNERARRRRRV